MEQNIIKNERGSAGMLAIVVMTLMGAIGAAFVVLSTNEINISANFRDGVAAEYLAEAGTQWAIVQLKTNDTFVKNTGNATGVKTDSADKNGVTPTKGKYSVTVTGTGNSRTVISTGTVSQAKRRVILTVALPTGGGTSGIYSSWNNH